MNPTAPLHKLWTFLLLAASLGACSAAQTPQLQKTTPPPSLVPLPASIGGRALAVPSPSHAFGPSEYRSQWPGATFDAAFRGPELYFRIGANHEILHVVVDGQPPLKLVRPEPGVYRLSGLANASHSVRILTVTESQDAPNSFGGFALAPGERARPAVQPSRQIEFIGDSHTVGYGDTSPTRACNADQVWAATDNSQAFGPLVAAHYRAAYQVNAISGRGIVRNYNGSPGDTLPVAYPYVLFDRKQKYSDPAWKPQILVVALGTNDFTTPLNPGEPWKTRNDLHADFEATYGRFLVSLRAAHPGAFIILWATDMANGEIESEVRKVADQARARGETRLAFLPIDRLQFTGCNWHPSLADHKTIRDRLVELIDSHPGIWQGN